MSLSCQLSSTCSLVMITSTRSERQQHGKRDQGAAANHSVDRPCRQLDEGDGDHLADAHLAQLDPTRLLKSQQMPSRSIPSMSIRRAVAATVGALLVSALLAGSAGRATAAQAQTPPAPAAQPSPTATLPPTRLAALPSRTIADGAAALAVTLSAPVYPSSPAPMLTPRVAGRWKISGDSEVFTPSSTLEPCSDYALTVWAGTTSTAHVPLGHRQTIRLHVACPPPAGLQQALANLGYLGARFVPLYDVHVPSGRETRRQAATYAFHPPRGRLVPDPSDAPPAQIGRLDETTRGALEVYQEDTGLPVSDEPDRATWTSLLYDESTGRRDREPYTWVTVSESEPEMLYLHRGDRVAFTTLVNTGVPGAETAQGIFPIYARYVSTTMAGEDPDGTKYDVADVPWVNYFNGGDAVHGYPRAAYGFPQSNGCVELPIEAAHTVYGMLQIGDIVDVRG
jgi:lipoprotein-anchoring transpeptidase ErfK/SrfK